MLEANIDTSMLVWCQPRSRRRATDIEGVCQAGFVLVSAGGISMALATHDPSLVFLLLVDNYTFSHARFHPNALWFK